MAKVDKKELYPLFHALSLHQSGKKTLSGVSLSGELLEAVEQFSRKHAGNLVKPESSLTVDRVKAILKLAKHDTEIRILLVEDGPEAPRPLTDEEILAQDAAREEEMAKLVKRFWISTSYGIVALCAAIMTSWLAWRMKYKQLPGEGEGTNEVGTTGQIQEINPMYIASLICVFVAAWGIADAFILAKNHWLDFDRAKAAVPVVGDRWAARSRRKKKERAAREGRPA